MTHDLSTLVFGLAASLASGPGGLIVGPEGATGCRGGLGLALLAGLGFGGFLILIGQVSHGAIFWPLVVAGLSSSLFMLAAVLIMRQEVLPKKEVLPLVLLAGTLDGAGNAFSLRATHAGRLDVRVVLSCPYPAPTGVLAAILLDEPASRMRATGVLLW